MIFSLLSSGFRFGGARASGGSVDPGQTVLVGEDGPELFTPRSGGTVTPHGFGGGDIHIHNHVDARGADLGAANRIRQALDTVHKNSVSQAVRASHERSKRVPR
jgi:hypothetical protein